MDGKLARILGIGALVAGLVLPGLMAMASARPQAAITEPETIELSLGTGDSAVSATADYRLRGPSWRKGGLSMMRAAVADRNDDPVGNVVWNCIQSKVAWLCDLILTLEDGPYTQSGQVMTSGRFLGFNGESVGVVGGTGAYANARGEATLSTDGDEFLLTLELLP
jgi:hypothetical protein